MFQGNLHLALKCCVSGPTDYMHMDFMDGKLAIICGTGMCLWAVQTSMRGREMQFSISQIPIPEGLLAPLNKSGLLMQPRTIHFLPETQSILLSFVADDVTKLASHL